MSFPRQLVEETRSEAETSKPTASDAPAVTAGMDEVFVPPNRSEADNAARDALRHRSHRTDWTGELLS